MSAVLFLFNVALAWYGALRAFKNWFGHEEGGWVFSLPGATLYTLLAILSFNLFLWSDSGQASDRDALAMVLPLAMALFMALPYAFYLATLVYLVARQYFSPLGALKELHSYDRGDAAMARRDFGVAVERYREDLARWPEDLNALFRLASALTAVGRPESAALELEGAWRRLLAQPPAPDEGFPRPSPAGYGARRREHFERILELAYALGDLYQGPLGKPESALALYETTLTQLYGYEGSEPLRERLRSLQGREARDGRQATNDKRRMTSDE